MVSSVWTMAYDPVLQGFSKWSFLWRRRIPSSANARHWTVRKPGIDGVFSPAVLFSGSGEWRESQEEENLDSWSLFCEQAGEVAGGDDASGLVTGERQQAAFVAGDEVIRVAGLRQRQQEVVARVG